MKEHKTITKYQYQYHMEDSSSSSHKKEEEEEHVLSVQDDTNKEATRRIAWHCHIIM